MRVEVHTAVTPRLLRPLTGREDAFAYGGYRPGREGGELLEAVEASGLRGRGGAAFPTAIKLRAVADGDAPRYVVANGEEGEPASIKDRWLLRHRPHLVIDGMLRVAAALDAEGAWIYVSDEAAVASIEAALGEVRLQIPVDVAVVSPGYVAGEETSVVRAIDGGPAKPTAKPPRPFETGVASRPTAVLNVETLANVPAIAVDGPEAFRAAGTPSSPGTFLFSLSGAVFEPGLYELPLGITLGAAIDAVGGGLCDDACGFLMGGFFAGLLGPRALDLVLAYDELRAERSGLGCGAVVVLGADECPVQAAAEVMGFFARENAKQCGACINGTSAMRDVLLRLASGSCPHSELGRLERWSRSLRGRGACATLDGAAQLASSLLLEFDDVVAAHAMSSCTTCAARPVDFETAGERFRV